MSKLLEEDRDAWWREKPVGLDRKGLRYWLLQVLGDYIIWEGREYRLLIVLGEGGRGEGRERKIAKNNDKRRKTNSHNNNKEVPCTMCMHIQFNCVLNALS